VLDLESDSDVFSTTAGYVYVPWEERKTNKISLNDEEREGKELKRRHTYALLYNASTSRGDSLGDREEDRRLNGHPQTRETVSSPTPWYRYEVELS
jgi:hypothetical protein